MFGNTPLIAAYMELAHLFLPLTNFLGPGGVPPSDLPRPWTSPKRESPGPYTFIPICQVEEYPFLFLYIFLI